jgi:hypothetical protein
MCISIHPEYCAQAPSIVANGDTLKGGLGKPITLLLIMRKCPTQRQGHSPRALVTGQWITLSF